MKPLKIVADSLRYPKLFDWNGPVERERLEQWLNDRGLKVPHDLEELWARTGGGEAFEGETILGNQAV